MAKPLYKSWHKITVAALRLAGDANPSREERDWANVAWWAAWNGWNTTVPLERKLERIAYLRSLIGRIEDDLIGGDPSNC
jgi:hypothetical protein